MSEAPDKDQKTHAPTDKKLEDARKKGDVVVASEIRHAVMMGAGIAVVGGLGSMALSSLGSMFVRLWGGADDFALSPAGAQDFTAGIMIEIASGLAPILGMLLGLAILTLFLQGRPTLAWSRVGFKWSKLSPMAGFGRLFGARALIEFLKTFLKCAGVITVASIVLWPKAVGLDQLIGSDPVAIGHAAGDIVLTMIKSVAILVAAIALFDFVYQHRSFLNRMRMTAQEIKDEFKQNQGDPHIKSRRRSIAGQRARKRMMAAVPGASVIVTNTTHYAVALKYAHGDMAAPVVVAKGVDAIALKIREIASEAGVPIVESPPLARALFASVDIDRPIPIEHYAAVAEIIGYVMRLAKRR